MPMDIDMNQDASVLASNHWYLETVHEGSSADSCQADYMDHMDFPSDAGVADQRFQLLQSIGSGGPIPQDLMHMSPVELDSEKSIPRQQESNAQYHVEQPPAELDQTADEAEYLEPNFSSQGSTTSRDASQDTEALDDQEAKFLHIEDTTPPSTDRTPSPAASSVMHLDQPQDGSSEDNAISLDDAPAETETPVTVASTSHCKPQAPTKVDDDMPFEQSGSAATDLDEEKVITDENKASDLIKSLEDQGTLAKILEQLGYQKAKAPEVMTKKGPSGQGITAENGQIICSERNCGKAFHRRCELK